MSTQQTTEIDKLVHIDERLRELQPEFDEMLKADNEYSKKCVDIKAQIRTWLSEDTLFFADYLCRVLRDSPDYRLHRKSGVDKSGLPRNYYTLEIKSRHYPFMVLYLEPWQTREFLDLVKRLDEF